MTKNNQPYTVTAFYQGELRHPRHGSLQAIHQNLQGVANNIFYESDFIAWLFPWPKKIDDSQAPLLTEADLEYFHNHYELRRTFIRTLQIILSYYGMEVKSDKIIAASNFAQVASLWLTAPDHNNLDRIQLFLSSMTILGEKSLAESMLEVLTRVQTAFPNNIPMNYISVWQKAIAEGEKQFYLLFTQPLYTYAQFWLGASTDKNVAIQQVAFSNRHNANLLLNLLLDKGFHSTKVNETINTIKIYEEDNLFIIYLSTGQYAIFKSLHFPLPQSDKYVTGKQLIEYLLGS